MKVVRVEDIRVPIFHPEPPHQDTPSIGLKDYQCTKGVILEVHIAYTLKDGRREYPKPFYILGEKAEKYKEKYKNGCKLRIVPIKDLLTQPPVEASPKFW